MLTLGQEKARQQKKEVTFAISESFQMEMENKSENDISLSIFRLQEKAGKQRGK